eukprot:3513005-Pyramimonas_sp.AAC.1
MHVHVTAAEGIRRHAQLRGGGLEGAKGAVAAGHQPGHPRHRARAVDLQRRREQRNPTKKVNEK